MRREMCPPRRTSSYIQYLGCRCHGAAAHGDGLAAATVEAVAQLLEGGWVQVGSVLARGGGEVRWSASGGGWVVC